MKRISIALVDDEPLARDRLRRLLKDEADADIVAECRDGQEAVEAVRTRAPDLLLLDVQMPGMDGFETLQAMRTLELAPLPEIIFVTGFDHHAVRAFEARALDYLLKPTTKARLAEAMRRVRERVAARSKDSTEFPLPAKTSAGTLPPTAASSPATVIHDLPQAILELLAERKASTPRVKRIPVRTGERIHFIAVEDIAWIEAAGNYVVLHVGNATHILRETMGSLEDQLAAELFCRVSRSAIINLHSVKELITGAGGDQFAALNGGQRIPVTRSLRELEDKLRFSK
ncbi:MAG TPA: LytTR family DNA-binding domain-containing protein [Candidatus Methylacidiphilales bacterium]|nr:LytTR family DNA-binding domain-containing protein [Candidatus Methylacidiphilales bacterium]